MIFFTLVMQFDRTVSLSQSILMTMEHSNEKQLKVTDIIKRTIKIKRLCTKKCCYPAYEFSASKGNGLESLGKPSGNVFFLLNGTYTRRVKTVHRVSGIVTSLSVTDLLLRPRSLSLEECFSDEYRTLFKNKFELICTCFL